MNDFVFLMWFAAVTILMCRMLPFFFKENKYLNNKDSFVYKTINYSAQAMIGLIVYHSAFSGRNVVQLWETAGVKEGLIISFLVLMFVLTIKTRKMIPCFLLFLGVYGVLVWVL